MENPLTLQLPDSNQSTQSVNYQLASEVIHPLPGRFYAVEHGAREKIGNIWLPDATSISLQSDFLTVVAVGKGVDLKPGDTALVRPTHGDFIEGAEFGPYKAENRVRVYGRAYEFQGVAKRVRWDECAPVQVHSLKECVQWGNRVKLWSSELELEAKGINILIKRDPVITSEAGFELPESARYRSCMATVVSVGKFAARERPYDPNSPQMVKVGDRVHYNPMGLLDFAFSEDKDLACIQDDAINAVINEREMAIA